MIKEEKNIVKCPIVREYDETDPIPCPYGNVRRVVTAGEGGIANVHVVCVNDGKPHIHREYDEVYYILSGAGTLNMDSINYSVKKGSVAVIPAGTVHTIASKTDDPLEFIIFGTPPFAMDDERALPVKPEAIHFP